MTSCGPYIPTAGGCVPHTEVFWARKESDASPVLLYLQVTCVAGKAVKTLTTDKAGTTPAVGYTEADKIGTVIKGERGASCEDPLHTVICEGEGNDTPALDAALCDGSTVDVKTAGLAKRIVNEPGTALLVKMICDEKFDREFETQCAPDGKKVAVQNVTPDDAPLGTAPVYEFWTIGSPSVLYTGDVSLLTDCASEKVDLTDSESYCAAGANYSRIDVVDVITKAIIGTLWLNDTGTVVSAPAGAVKGTCEQIASNTAIIAQLTTANVTLAALLAEQDKELSFTTPIQICAGGVGYLVRQRSVYDSEAAAPISLVAEYTTDGVTWTTTAPIVAITLGECPKCEVAKQFEFLNYRTPETTGLQNLQGMFQGDNADFTQSLAGDFEFYLVVDGTAQYGTGAGAGYGAQYPLQFTSLQAVANWLNSHSANTAPKDNWVIGGLAGNQYIAISNTAGGVPSNHTWNDLVLAHYVSAGSIDYNLFKSSPVTKDVDLTIPAQCRTIEVLKEVDCNRVATLFGFEIDGTPIVGFDPKNLRYGTAKEVRRDICVTMKPVAPATVGVRWDIKEIETTSPCGDATVRYFDPDVSPMVEVDESLIECINGEGKCPCDCGTTTPTPHVFKNASIPAGNSVWTVPSTSASPVSRFQVTARDAKGSTLDIKVTGLTTTTFSIDATVASSNIEIFVEPMQTFS